MDSVQLARVESEIAKLIAESAKLNAETSKLNAEAAKMHRERTWHPVVVGAALATAFIAVARFLI